MIIKRIAAVAAMATAGVLATGCSHMTAGTVTGKQFTPAHTETIWITLYCGKSCFTVIPEQQYDGPDWELHLKAGKKTGWDSVDQSTYRQTPVGSYFSEGK